MGQLRGESGGLRLQDLYLVLQLGDVPHASLLGPRRRLPVGEHPARHRGNNDVSAQRRQTGGILASILIDAHFE
jgi:hypothetical protein